MTKPLNKTLNAILASATLPTLPVVASKLMVLTSQKDAAICDIVDLISQDMALSARILKVANSAFYGFPRQIASINQAVSLLGINAVQSLVLGFTFLSMGEEKEGSLFSFDRFWEGSLVGATAAKLIAEQVPQINNEEIFTVGLLRNIGQLIFAMTVPSRYDQILQRLAVDGKEICEVALEEEYLGISHATSGFEVARLWGLPSIMLAVIQYHHAPATYLGSDQQQIQTINAVYLADLITKIFTSKTPERYHQQVQGEAQQLLGLSTLKIKTILQAINWEISQVAQLFSVSINPLRSIPEILQEANIRLSLLHLTYEEMNRELMHSKKMLEELRGQLVERNHLLDQLANLDGLTEINNHRFFQNFLCSEIKRSVSNKGALSLLLADIDHFKKFNDTHGHQTGDFILKELCRVAERVIREYDIIARYGGEEFVFVLPETEPEGALIVAQRLCMTIANHDFFDGNIHYKVTVSIGVASAFPSCADFSKNEFIDMADGALYEAKNRGRNQVVLFNPQEKKKWFSMWGQTLTETSAKLEFS